jgi:hydroxyethylthiazole kinase-like uncharacterized protein yjeF
MTELLTAAQMRAIEAAAIASGEVTGLELMERAGRGVVEAIFEEWPELKATSHRAVVLCGPGNNGGDGFVVARLLHEWGWEVEVLSALSPERMPTDAAHQAREWARVGTVRELTYEVMQHQIPAFDLCIDAIFGLGFSPRHPSDYDDALIGLSGIRGVAAEGGRVVAVDAPSGLCLESGRGLAQVDAVDPSADLTVTFDCLKPGHLLADGPHLCGKTVVVDIGIAPWRQFRGPAQRPDGSWHGIRHWRDLGLVGPQQLGGPDSLQSPGVFSNWRLGKSAAHFFRSDRHKYSHGHALILAGSSGRGGAARLAARGALRIGAGVVTVGCPADAIPENAARLDAVMLRPVSDAMGLASILDDRRINTLCVGPGLGLGMWTGDRQRGLMEVVLQLQGVWEGGPWRTVLDADALTILSRHPDLFAALHEGCILTPHAGEFTRLFPDIAEKLSAPATTGPAYSKVDATREAAKRAGCVVLFKGPDTVIADPTGRCAINSAHYDRAAPWLATAGSGDVLAGFITGLLARGFNPFDAACTGAWLHVECALSFGPGLIAEDLPEELPKVFRALGL